MKKIVFIVLIATVVAVLCIPSVGVAFADEDFNAVKYPSVSAYLVDFGTGTVLVDKNSDEKRPIASMVKIMTLLLTFEEIDDGRMTLDEKIVVSENASGMGGSQMFLDSGKEYPVTDLIKGVTVCSANDAAYALGERISGNIDSFVSKMNEYAKEIGMDNTLFCNATGLPDSGEQYSTAKDVTTMFRRLLTKQKYFDYTKIWMENYEHPDGRVTEIVNTNKLIRFYKYCDAGKTGFTNEAKFCLAASAVQNGMRVVGTVLGSDTSKDRFKEMTDLFNYAFSNFEVKTIFQKGDLIENNIKVSKAKDSKILLTAENDVSFFTRKGKSHEFEIKTEIPADLTAPIKKGDKVGQITVLDSKGEILCRSALLARNDVEKRGYGDAINDVLDKWIFR